MTISAPGQYVAYRVSANRNNQTSPASTPVVLWDTEEAAQLPWFSESEVLGRLPLYQFSVVTLKAERE